MEGIGYIGYISYISSVGTPGVFFATGAAHLRNASASASTHAERRT